MGCAPTLAGEVGGRNMQTDADQKRGRRRADRTRRRRPFDEPFSRQRMTSKQGPSLGPGQSGRPTVVAPVDGLIPAASKGLSAPGHRRARRNRLCRLVAGLFVESRRRPKASPAEQAGQARGRFGCCATTCWQTVGRSSRPFPCPTMADGQTFTLIGLSHGRLFFEGRGRAPGAR